MRDYLGYATLNFCTPFSVSIFGREVKLKQNWGESSSVPFFAWNQKERIGWKASSTRRSFVTKPGLPCI